MSEAEVVDRSELHQIGADEAGESEQAFDRVLRSMSQTQQQIDDERDSDLGAHGVLSGAEEVVDFESVLYPTEEQLDVPPLLVEVGDGLSRGIEIVGDDAQNLASVEPHVDLAQGFAHGVLARSRHALRQGDEEIGEDGAVGGRCARLEDGGARVLLETGDELGALGIDLGPPGKVIKSKVL